MTQPRIHRLPGLHRRLDGVLAVVLHCSLRRDGCAVLLVKNLYGKLASNSGHTVFLQRDAYGIALIFRLPPSRR